MPPSLTENVVEQAALDWFEELGYERLYGPDTAPDEAGAERGAFGDVVLVDRLRQALDQTNEDIPAEALDHAVRKVLITESPSLSDNSRRLHRSAVEGVLLA